MKVEYTREAIVEFIRNLDTRARDFNDARIDDVINRGYAELMTVTNRIFSNEDVVELAPYYETNELKVSLDVEDDATEVYDVYVTEEGDV